ncbi:MAG: pentapeptide repeat-containing protein, partial [Nostoc sp.]
MPQEKSCQNLRGRSFKGQNLEGANFSYADIRGADFTGANLIGANFSHVQAGLQRRWAIFIFLISWLLVGVSGFLSSLAGYLAAAALGISNFHNQIAGLTAVVMLVIFFVITIRRGMQTGFGAIAIALASALVVISLGTTIVLIVALIRNQMALWIGYLARVITGDSIENAFGALILTVAVALALLGALRGAVAIS